MNYDNIPIVEESKLGEAKFPCKFCPATARFSVKFYHENESSGGYASWGQTEDAYLCEEHFRRQKVLGFFQDKPKSYNAQRAYQDSIGIVWAEAQRQLSTTEEVTLRDLLSSDELKVEISPIRPVEKGAKK